MADAKSPKQEGTRIAVELIRAMRDIKGLKGVHLQAIEAEELLPDIIKEAGLSPRPQV
jgi:hypothetical protein